ncbi:MAG: hypothetical protein IPO17_12645 [Flavobacteriales bacterium]|nr:hypothetical protein [Flavobacteriales bacterium]
MERNRPRRISLIAVTDNDDPTITCSANDTLSISSATCDVVMPVYAATATDNCAVDLIWQTAGPVAGDVLSVIGSPYSTIWFARDATGNNSSCVQSIVVIDVDAPDVICPLYDSIEYYLDANCQLAFPDLRDSVTVADCSAWTNTMWPPAGMVFSQDTVVQMTMDIDDIHGNHRDNDHLIWIRDTIAPVIICPSDTIVQASPATCLATITPAPLAFGDNCSATSWTSSLPAGSYPAGVYPITLTAIAGTHTATCSYAVAVRDTMIACTGSNTFTAAPAGNCTANVTLPVQDTTTVDLCGPWTWGGSTHSDGAWAVNDTVPVTYTVIDPAGFPAFLRVRDHGNGILTARLHIQRSGHLFHGRHHCTAERDADRWCKLPVHHLRKPDQQRRLLRCCHHRRRHTHDRMRRTVLQRCDRHGLHHGA